MDGWIKIHRSLLAWEWWDDPVMVKSYVSMLLLCNTRPKRWHGIAVEPGSFITSRSHLTTILGISEQQVRTVMKRLSETGEITIRTTRNYTVVTVNNWQEYQATNQPSNQGNELKMPEYQPTEQPRNNQPITNEQPTDNHNQERENIYIPPVNCPPRGTAQTPSATGRGTLGNPEPGKPAGSEKAPVKRFVKPTVEEIAEFCRKRGNNIDPQHFWSYYESKGWVVGKAPMKNWQAAILNWERSDQERRNNGRPGSVKTGYDFAPDESGTGDQGWEARR